MLTLDCDLRKERGGGSDNRLLKIRVSLGFINTYHCAPSPSQPLPWCHGPQAQLSILPEHFPQSSHW